MTRPLHFSALLALLLAIAGTASAQGVVSGRVVDAETGEGLPSVHVFLSGTLEGTTSGRDGAFELTGLAAGTYQLVASMIGFETRIEAVEVGEHHTAAAPLAVTLRLAAAVYEAGEVVVEARRPRHWRRDLRHFERLFLGQSNNVRQTRITNPEVLDFNRDSRSFKATASAPLVIENRALGYRIHYVLFDFRMDEDTGLLHYLGTSRFEELGPRNKREEARWQERRREAYTGSLKHFLRALHQGALAEQGFAVHFADRRPDGQFAHALETVDPDALTSATNVSYEYRLDFDGFLHVAYNRAAEETVYRTTHGRPERGALAQESYVRLNRPAVINAQGYANNPYDVVVYNYWSWKDRIADLLPLNYLPDEGSMP